MRDHRSVLPIIENYAWLAFSLLIALQIAGYLVIYSGITFREIDVYVFYQYAQNINAGMVPYRDFVVEFPMAAVIFYYVPQLFSSTEEGYVMVFAVMVGVFTFLTFLLSIIMMRRQKLDLWMQAVFTIAFYCFLHYYFMNLAGKFDIFVVFFSLLAVFLFIEGKKTWAYAVVAFSTLIKFYPGFILLLFLAYDLHRAKADGYGIVVKNILCVVAVGVASALPFLLLGTTPGQLTEWISFHSDRGFQVESTIGVLVEFFGDNGIGSYTIEPRYNTYDVVCPLTDFLSPFWTYVVFGLVALFILSFALFIRRNGLGEDGYDLAYLMTLGVLGVVLMFVFTNKVFSTQYLSWFLPWILILGAFRTLPEHIALCISFVAIVYLSRDVTVPLPSTMLFLRALIIGAVIVYLWILTLRGGYPKREESAFDSIIRLISSRRPRSHRRT